MDHTQKHGTMLDYAKVILPKVAFSKSLFRKELKKCIQWVERDQISELHDWCYKNFENMYPEILSEAFSTVAA